MFEAYFLTTTYLF